MTTTSKTGLTDKFRIPKTKVCRLCQKEKPIKDFNLSLKGRFGYTNECRDCKKEHEANKEMERKEKAKNFFDAKFFILLVFLTTSLTAFSQVSKYAICYHNTSACMCSSGEVVVRDTVSRRKPDTLRAICLVSLFQNGIAHARMGFVVIEQGKRPVYLDCRKRALKGSQMGWGFREVDVNYKQKVK